MDIHHLDVYCISILNHRRQYHTFQHYQVQSHQTAQSHSRNHAASSCLRHLPRCNRNFADKRDSHHRQLDDGKVSGKRWNTRAEHVFRSNSSAELCHDDLKADLSETSSSGRWMDSTVWTQNLCLHVEFNVGYLPTSDSR